MRQRSAIGLGVITKYLKGCTQSFSVITAHATYPDRLAVPFSIAWERDHKRPGSIQQRKISSNFTNWSLISFGYTHPLLTDAVLLRGEGAQIQQPARVSPLVIVPRDHLNQGLAHHHRAHILERGLLLQHKSGVHHRAADHGHAEAHP